MPTPPRFQAFLSYSHAADTRTTAALQAALQRIGKRWWQRATVRVFRDQTDLAAAPGLWAEIEKHLADADWFVLMASPQAAASPWVRREIDWWLRHRSADRLLVALTAGELQWQARAQAFDAAGSPSLPPALLAAWPAEPLWVDLRWAAAEPRLSLRHTRFRDAVLTLAARLQGRDKNELDSAEIREHRRFVQAAIATALAFNIVLVGAGAFWWQAREQRQRAEQNWREAQSRRLAGLALEELAQNRLDRAAQLAVLAWRLDDGDAASTALRRVVAAGPGVASLLGQHAGRISALAFSGDGRWLFSAGSDGSLMRWRSADWQAAGPPVAAVADVEALRADATGARLFAWNGKGPATWWQQAAGGGGTARPLVFAPPADEWLWNAAIAANGDGLLLVLRDEARFWRPGTDAAQQTLTLARGRQRPGRLLGGCLRAEGTARLLADTGEAVDVMHTGLRVIDWRPGAARPPDEGPRSREGWRQNVHVVRVGLQPVWDAECKRFVLWDEGRPTIWSVDSARVLRREAQVSDPALADPHGHGDVAAAFLAGGEVLLAAGDGGLLGKGVYFARWPAAAASAPLPGASLPLSASPDGRWLAAAGGASLLLWDAQAGPWGTPAARRLAATCSTLDEGCAARLCAAAGRPLDEEELRRLFGIANFEYFYDTYRRIVDAAACPVQRPPSPLLRQGAGR